MCDLVFVGLCVCVLMFVCLYVCDFVFVLLCLWVCVFVCVYVCVCLL